MRRVLDRAGSRRVSMLGLVLLPVLLSLIVLLLCLDALMAVFGWRARQKQSLRQAERALFPGRHQRSLAKLEW